MIWFTADLHLGHAAILGHCPSRMVQFNDLHTMNKSLIDTINKHVQSNDILYHLGDFCWSASKAGHYRAKINCRTIHALQGNHDASSLKKYVSSYAQMIFIKKYHLHLCHYPLASWWASCRGSQHLHGHCHGRLTEIPNRIDVGIDAIYAKTGEWRPMCLDEILIQKKDFVTCKDMEHMPPKTLIWTPSGYYECPTCGFRTDLKN